MIGDREGNLFDGLSCSFGGDSDGEQKRKYEYVQRSSACHHPASSSRSGDTPPWTMAAAEIGYLILWCWVLPEKGCSGRSRSRIPSQSMGSEGVAPDMSMASEASSRSSSAGNVLYRMCRAPSLERISSDSSPDARPARAIRMASLRSSGVGC